MINWSSLFNKIENMRVYCINASESDCDELYKIDSQLAYNNQFNELVFAITAYKEDIAQKQSQLTDIIMMDFANTIIGNITYDPPIFKPSSPYPEGYLDYSLIYNMNNMINFIMSAATSYFYQGCIVTPGGTTSNLQNAINNVENAEGIEQGKRQALISYVRQFPQINALIYLTENFTITGTPKSKTEVGDIIYNQKHAKDIIDSFNLTVYIPSYIV